MSPDINFGIQKAYYSYKFPIKHNTQINEYILIFGSVFLTNDKSMSFTDLI